MGKVIMFSSDHMAMRAVGIPIEIKQANRDTIQQYADKRIYWTTQVIGDWVWMDTVSLDGGSLGNPLVERIY
jgi:hypothetical protein